MSLPAIEVSGFGKHYVLQHESWHDNLRDTLHHTARKLWRRLRWGTGFESEEFWALRDVSFKIEPGEVVGIIGRNGAGKSTLLKILSRITEPSTGRVTLRGRVASLLEVGTGFHPDLTGRENIFLNGAILGMSRIEIRKKFDEIVAFAEVEKFIDTPVKHYSSGMYVRLAFAVAAHLEPEILIVDEVLAVGDSAFQKKCLGKMRSVSQSEGRTVLFVSHNLPSVRTLCGTAILLSAGRVETAGPCARVLEAYQHGLVGAEVNSVPKPSVDMLDRAYVTHVAVETTTGVRATTFQVGQPWRLRVDFRIANAQSQFVVAIGLLAADGSPVQTCWISPRDLPCGDYRAVFTQNQVALEAGAYTTVIGLSSRDHSLQQFRSERIEITGESAPGTYAPATAGVGAVLNSMATELTQLDA